MTELQLTSLEQKIVDTVETINPDGSCDAYSRDEPSVNDTRTEAHSLADAQVNQEVLPCSQVLFVEK